MTSTAAVEVLAAPLPAKRIPSTIQSVEYRARLKPQRAPHWEQVKRGQFIGFRKMTNGSVGSWLCRVWIAHERDYTQESLGSFEETPESERYGAAYEKARPFFERVNAGGSTEKVTVRQAGEAYIQRKLAEEGERAARYAEAAIRRTIDSEIADVLLSKLTEAACMAWRQRLLERAGGVQNTSSFNRSLVEPRAALNAAFEDKKIASRPWQRALKRLENDHSDGEARDLYLDREQRQRFVDACSDEIRPFVAALAQMPMRCGEMGALKVSMLDVRGQSLKIPVSKTRARTVPLGNSMLAFFAAQAEGKQSNDWLFSRSDGAQWDANAWGPLVRAARAKAALSEKACLYSLRHSTIVDLVVNGCDLMTTARVAGTSLSQIEKHYGKLLPAHAIGHLDKLAFNAPTNVIALKVAA